ncbi:sodium-dependent glucose transporter 1C-like isoform X2 [Ruditapes philippinarum]|uniref:sodium-dependent glucose transporter 1C-like isoform X2 n=1 Tax=Ruditapes philippinarum TaxID=129788 RepID=UPI00295B87A3|nr:sodium-dependent glucose transporter 1C-like isoform X2 [Ruditapes philippinarum]
MDEKHNVQEMEIESKHQNLKKRLRNFFTFSSTCQKKNLVQTVCVYFNILLLGWTYGQLGTAFPDIQLILGTNVEHTSLLFTVNSFGYMTGSLTIGFIYDRVQRLKLLGIVSIINGITSAVSPWCSQYWLFLFVRLVDGFLAGGRDSSGNAKVMSCWGKHGAPFMLALHFSFAIGGIISPLVTRNFLAPKLGQIENNNTAISHGWNMSNNFTTSGNLRNITGHDEKEQVIYAETKIQWAFLITGVLTALSGILYIILFCYGYEKVPTYTKTNENESGNQSSSKVKRVKLSKCQLILFLILLGFSVISSTAVECKALSFIMSFVLLQLNWSKSDGAFLISLMWTFYSIGRFSGIFVSKLVRTHKILITNMIVIIVSSVVLYFGSIYNISGIVWTMVPLMGAGISCCFPTFMVWTHENVLKITGKVGGYFQFCGSIGCFIDPLYIGALMENVSPLYFIYLQIIQSGFSLSVFIVIVIGIARLKQTVSTM